jgi:hypothetical protein
VRERTNFHSTPGVQGIHDTWSRGARGISPKSGSPCYCPKPDYVEAIETTPEIVPATAAEYRRAYGRRLMTLTTLKSAVAERDELCRISSVDTIAPGLWIGVTFLDGSVKRFRPDKIRPATADEERME